MCDVVLRRQRVADFVPAERVRAEVVSNATVVGRSSVGTQTESDGFVVDVCRPLANATTASQRRDYYDLSSVDQQQDQCCKLDFVPWPCQLLQRIDTTCDAAAAAAADDDDDDDDENDDDGLSFNSCQTECEVYRSWLRYCLWAM